MVQSFSYSWFIFINISLQYCEEERRTNEVYIFFYSTTLSRVTKSGSDGLAYHNPERYLYIFIKHPQDTRFEFEGFFLNYKRDIAETAED